MAGGGSGGGGGAEKGNIEQSTMAVWFCRIKLKSASKTAARPLPHSQEKCVTATRPFIRLIQTHMIHLGRCVHARVCVCVCGGELQ